MEMHKKNGEQYPLYTVQHICCGIVHHLQGEGQADISIFLKDNFFLSFYRCIPLGNEMVTEGRSRFKT